MATLPNANVIFGPILLGTLFNWGLFGILGLQTYLYFIWFPNDRSFVKWLVAFLFLLDSLQTALSTYNLWFMLVSGWGNGNVVFITPWDLCLAVILTGLVSAIVQMYFAYRVWMLGRSIIITCVIVLISITQCVSAITGGIQVWVNKPDNSKLLPTFDAFSLWLASSLACDIVIAASMVYLLIKLKPKSSLKAADALITRLINKSVQTGTVTAVCAGVNLTLFLRFRNNNLQDVAFFMLGKLYSNTLLANLNVRRSLQSTGDTEAAVSAGILTDPQAISVGFWPHITTSDTGGSRDLSMPSESVREPASSATETEVSMTNLSPSIHKIHHATISPHYRLS